jgi:regulator of ribonuclease activity A
VRIATFLIFCLSGGWRQFNKEKTMTWSAADLFDEHASILRSCSIQFRDFGARSKFCGPVRTLQCHNDNKLFKSMLSEAADGAVLVVDGGGSLDAALLGDMNAALGMRSGWSGCVIYGAVRDSRVLCTLDFGIKAIGTNPAKCSKTGSGDIDVPIEFGGARFEPGQWIYCDDDGLAIAPHDLLS